MNKKDHGRKMNQDSENNILPNQTKPANKIWDKLKHRAEKVGYGSMICEMQVHEGKIKQIDITMVKERVRID